MEDPLVKSLQNEVEVAHLFEQDLRRTVLISWEYALQEIERQEDEAVAAREAELALEDYEVVSDAISHERVAFEDYKQSANQLALVGLITRFQHWINRTVSHNPHAPIKGGSLLRKQLEFLDQNLGPGPTPPAFFIDAETARDSVIHGDSQAEWLRGTETRSVDKRYRNAYGQVSISQDQVEELATKCIKHLIWSELVCPR